MDRIQKYGLQDKLDQLVKSYGKDEEFVLKFLMDTALFALKLQEAFGSALSQLAKSLNDVLENKTEQNKNIQEDENDTVEKMIDFVNQRNYGVSMSSEESYVKQMEEICKKEKVILFPKALAELKKRINQ